MLDRRTRIGLDRDSELRRRRIANQHREAVRPLLISRKLAVDAATKHLILIKALIVTLPLDFREQLEGLSNAAWSSAAVCSGPGQAQPRKCSSR